MLSSIFLKMLPLIIFVGIMKAFPNHEPLSRLFLYLYYYLMIMLLSLCDELHIVYINIMAV